MTNYSKRSAKYSKNITPYTKRRRYIRKNSRRNKKIFYGGTIRTFEFTNNNITYTLTKKKPFLLNLRGAGTYKLTMNGGATTLLIDAQSLSYFIVDITKPTNLVIMHALYAELNSQSENKSTPFHFESLYAGLKVYYEIYKDLPFDKINPDLPKLINQYTLPLGSGGNGIVYSVTYNGKNCALKVINFIDKDVELVMSREVIIYNIISQLACNTNIFCKFISTYCDFNTNTIYVLMEYCGSSLYEFMSNPQKTTISTSITPKNIYEWLINIATGLQCMHENKYVHLDIKPDNIVLDTTNLTSKLIDFGFAYYFSEDNKIPDIAGTRYYMSPEMINGLQITDITKHDVYSLGITFIECAFAFEYPDTYKNCLSSKASKKLFYSILRYDYSLHPQPSQTEFILSVVTVDLSGNVTIAPIKYTGTTVVYTIRYTPPAAVYTLSELYTNLCAIHEEYPLFRDMIKTNPVQRCSIADVISACNSATDT